MPTDWPESPLPPTTGDLLPHSEGWTAPGLPLAKEGAPPRGIDVYRSPAAELDQVEDDAMSSSPNHDTVSTCIARGKRSYKEHEVKRECSHVAGDEDEGESLRKKLKLSKNQSAILEDSFTKHKTLNPDEIDEEVGIVKQLGKLRDAEMEELEKEYYSLRSEEQDLLKNLRRHKDEDAIKGQAVKNQKALWDKTLEFRFLLQKSFLSSNKLPQEPARSYFCSSNTAVDEAYSDLLSSTKKTLHCMLELEEALLENNISITQGSSTESYKFEDFSATLIRENDEDWFKICKLHCRIIPFRNSSIDKWHRKTQVTTGAAAFRGKMNAFNQNVSDQVAGYMRDPTRMIKRMQLRRSSVGVYGNVSAECRNANEEDGSFDGDPELLDDSEFYQHLLKEFFESCDSTTSGAAFYALKKLQPKKRKIVDRRASKSRKIRYNVHEKIVNFMAPIPMVLSPMAPRLFENLFGMDN